MGKSVSRKCKMLTESLVDAKEYFIMHGLKSSNLNFRHWGTIFANILEKHAPVKTKRIKRKTQPELLKDDIKSAAKIRETYHNHQNWRQYKFWRNKTTSSIRKAKSELFAKSIAENKINTFL